MLFQLGEYLQQFWGPARLLTSYAVIMIIVLFAGYFLAYKLIPVFYDKLPHDRGREFTLKDKNFVVEQINRTSDVFCGTADGKTTELAINMQHKYFYKK